MTLRDLLCGYPGIGRGCYLASASCKSESKYDQVVKCTDRLREFQMRVGAQIPDRLASSLLVAVTQATRLNGKYFTFAITKPSDLAKGTGAHIEIDRLSAEERRLDDSRTVAAIQYGWKRNSKPSELPGELFNSTDILPVFLKMHAVRQMEERLTPLRGLLPLCLLESLLMDVEVVPQSEGKYLVAVRAFAEKVGYFGAVVVDGCLLIKTFIFLTMAQTPEGRMMEKILRLGRHDLAWYDLHNLKTIVNSDLFEDPVLGPALEHSGCGGLKKIRSLCQDTASVQIASDLRKYMRMDPRREQAIMDMVAGLGAVERAS